MGGATEGCLTVVAAVPLNFGGCSSSQLPVGCGEHTVVWCLSSSELPVGGRTREVGDALHLGRSRRPELERCFDREIRESFTLQSSSSFLKDGFVEIQEPGSSKTSQYKTV